MPDKHGDNKKKHDPKEQRKPRNSRKSEKKIEKTEEVKQSPKVPVPQKPPVYEDPGPEFYKNLKRETDEIIKITQEENSKYKKKEIQSNWAKYEMPIESYEETEDQDVGADYDKLIQMPLSAGGHFQFKHERSWDTATGPSPYDKYFDINMDILSTAISTIPFYERNNIDKSLFSDTDILTMDNRATKYKQKYYNDKKYSTAETEAQDRIQNLLKTNEKNDNVLDVIEDRKQYGNTESIDSSYSENDLEQETLNKCDDIVLECNEKTVVQNEDKVLKVNSETLIKEFNNLENKDKDLVNAEKETKNKEDIEKIEVLAPPTDIEIENSEIDKCEELSNIKLHEKPVLVEMKPTKIKTEDVSATPKSNPIIESPEDLEKWLDDFLDE